MYPCLDYLNHKATKTKHIYLSLFSFYLVFSFMMGYQTNPNFSMFFSLENDEQNHHNYDPYNDHSSSTSVDCTLSLGTPSTRLDDHRRFSSANSNNISGDFYFHGGNAKTTSYKKGGGDHNLPRRCASCDTTSTPLWRNGPKGPKVIN